MAYQIEKGIPIPEELISFNQKENKYPFRDMEIGDSFLFEFSDPQELNTFKVSCRMQKYRNGKVFTTRIIEPNSSVRCWRTK